MRRLSSNFLLDGVAMTQRFQHLSDGLLYYDPTFYAYLKAHQVISSFPAAANNSVMSLVCLNFHGLTLISALYSRPTIFFSVTAGYCWR